MDYMGTFEQGAEDLDDEDQAGAQDQEGDDQEDDSDHHVAQVRKVQQKSTKLTLKMAGKLILLAGYINAEIILVLPTNARLSFSLTNALAYLSGEQANKKKSLIKQAHIFVPTEANHVSYWP